MFSRSDLNLFYFSDAQKKKLKQNRIKFVNSLFIDGLKIAHIFEFLLSQKCVNLTSI